MDLAIVRQGGCGIATSYQEEAILIMHFELKMPVGRIADDFTRPCEQFGRHYQPAYVSQKEIKSVIIREELRIAKLTPIITKE